MKRVIHRPKTKADRLIMSSLVIEVRIDYLGQNVCVGAQSVMNIKKKNYNGFCDLRRSHIFCQEIN